VEQYSGPGEGFGGTVICPLDRRALHQKRRPRGLTRFNSPGSVCVKRRSVMAAAPGWYSGVLWPISIEADPRRNARVVEPRRRRVARLVESDRLQAKRSCTLFCTSETSWRPDLRGRFGGNTLPSVGRACAIHRRFSIAASGLIKGTTRQLQTSSPRPSCDLRTRGLTGHRRLTRLRPRADVFSHGRGARHRD